METRLEAASDLDRTLMESEDGRTTDLTTSWMASYYDDDYFWIGKSAAYYLDYYFGS